VALPEASYTTIMAERLTLLAAREAAQEALKTNADCLNLLLESLLERQIEIKKIVNRAEATCLVHVTIYQRHGGKRRKMQEVSLRDLQYLSLDKCRDVLEGRTRAVQRDRYIIQVHEDEMQLDVCVVVGQHVVARSGTRLLWPSEGRPVLEAIIQAITEYNTPQ
jgi:hypothetical protein